MKKFYILFLILVLIFLNGCSESFEPKSENDTLLIGQISVRANGWQGNEVGISINGVTKGNIEITFTNTWTQKEFKITSAYKTGIFYKFNIEPGTYFISKLKIMNDAADGGSAWLWWGLKKENSPLILVQPGKVINLGSIMWVADNIRKVFTIYQSESPDELHKLFSTDFPKSQWLQREWVNLILTWKRI